MPSTLRVQLQLRIVSDDDTVIRDEVILQLDKSDDRLEACAWRTPRICSAGSSTPWSKPRRRLTSTGIAAAPPAVYAARDSTLPHRVRPCSARKPALLPLPLPTGGHFSPLAELFTEHTAPELLYLESRWASLISFGMTTALLRDVLPVADTPETVRQHLHKVAARQDAELGTGQPGLRNDGPADGQLSSVQREAVIVGIDGGYLRNWHDKRKKFEVIVGKSMAEDRDDRYFGLVRSQDAAPKHRFCEVLRRQGLPVDQPVTVLAVTASARSWAICRPAASINWTGSTLPCG
jgi:hypothetical protein